MRSANLKARAEELTEPWKPVVVAEASGFQVKVVRLHGEFPMHSHEAQDELFLCLSGEFDIELEEAESVTLKSGDVFVVPAGRRHRPVARKPATTALFEPAETRQYGE